MRRLFLILALILLLIFPGQTFAASYHNENVSIYVGEELIQFPDQGPYIDSFLQRTYVPVRFVSEALGADVSWNGTESKVTISGLGRSIILVIGSTGVEVDGKILDLDAPAELVNDRTMVPLRMVSEAFGAEVKWTSFEDGGRVDILPSAQVIETTPPAESGQTAGSAVILGEYPNTPKTELDASILDVMTKYKSVGLSAAFVKNGKVVWSGGYGWADMENQEAADSATIYRVASISKTVVGTALMKLYEQGKFGLDDDISSYLGFKVRNPGYPEDKITFRMLMTHTSSIQGDFVAELSNPPLLEDLLVPGGNYDSVWGNYRPGTVFSYSNLGCGIAACLVEKLSGERFDSYCAEHIFRPLGMDAAFQVADLSHPGEVAVLYKHSSNGQGFEPDCDYYKEGEVPQKEVHTLPLGNYYIRPAGGMRVSAADLAKFMIVHMNGGTYNGVRILKSDTVDLMQQMHWFGNGYEGFYKQKGLFFHISDGLADRRLTGHAGEAYGLLSDMYFDREEKTGVVLITNGGYGDDYLDSGFTNIEDAVINILYNEFAGEPKNVAKTVSFNTALNRVVAEGRKIQPPVSMTVKASDVFIPAITFADAFEAKIDLNQSTGVMTLSIGKNVLSLKTGKRDIVFNNRKAFLQAAPNLKDGQIMIPLNQVAKLFGAGITTRSGETMITM